MKKVLIVCIGNTGNEVEALRQTLEAFQCLVLVKYVGRPQDFIDVLQGELPFQADSIILSCHGEDGKIVMPMLGENVYTAEEPRGNFGAEEVKRYLGFRGKMIINTGCTTGEKQIAAAFAKENCYVAPVDYVEGSSALMFVIRFYYEMLQNKKPMAEAFEIAKVMDSETGLFEMQ